MKIPAIRSQMGEWTYYVATMTMDEISNNVKKIDNELHNSKTLSDMLQRSITNNYKNISEYLKNQDERFFNSLVLAVYDGDPQWQEIRFDYGDEEYFYNVGLLEFSGEEKIFPLDGQHRVEGIKDTLVDMPEFGSDNVPVIFIGHKNDSCGMQKSRRLFSTLNRYAKPVSLSDIIALDEDDAVAISTRKLIENYPLFKNEKVFISGSKSMPQSNKKAFTNVITLYECNTYITEIFISSMEIKDNDHKIVKSKSKKIELFKRFRPSDEILDELYNLLVKFWDSMLGNFIDIKYVSDEIEDMSIRGRTSEGGNLLFRPIGLSEFSKVVKLINEISSEEINTIIEKLAKVDYNINSDLWKRVVWDDYNKLIIPSNKVLISKILIYIYDNQLLEENKLTKSFDKLVSIYGFEDTIEVINHLERFRISN